jgi:hypothetical protein
MRKLAVLLFAVCAACVAPPSNRPIQRQEPPPSPRATVEVQATATPETIGSSEERLAVAAEIRHYLRDQEIPAYVVASGERLIVKYLNAQIEYAPDTFTKQRGNTGMRAIARAGFTELVIEARDADGKTQERAISLTPYQTK